VAEFKSHLTVAMGRMTLILDFHKIPQAILICARIAGFAAVAQLDRVLGYEPRGRGFDSCQPRQI
jgi:hypothetical protein